MPKENEPAGFGADWGLAAMLVPPPPPPNEKGGGGGRAADPALPDPKAKGVTVTAVDTGVGAAVAADPLPNPLTGVPKAGLLWPKMKAGGAAESAGLPELAAALLPNEKARLEGVVALLPKLKP